MKHKNTDLIYMKFQCDVIRAIDSVLKDCSVRKSARRKMVEEITFAASEVFEDHGVHVGLKGGSEFPFHEYAFGNVDWYYETGHVDYDKMDAKLAKEKEKHGSIEKVGPDFPKSGFDRLGKECCKWATKDGFVFSGWIGGSFDDEDIVNIWGEYFKGKSIYCRIKTHDKVTDWKKLKTVSGEKEKRMLQFKFKEKKYSVDFMIDDTIYSGLCSKDWKMA